MVQTHQTPFAIDLLQPTQREAAESPRPLIPPNTGSTITFRRAYNARPTAVFTFAAIRSGTLAVADNGSADPGAAS